MSKLRWPLAAVGVLALVGMVPAEPPKTAPETPTQPTSISEVGGRSFALWLADLKSPDSSRRADALVNLTGFGETAADAVPAVLDRLADHDVGVRTKAVIFLKVVNVRERDKAKVVEALARCVSTDTQAIVRYEAATALMNFPEDGKAAVNALIGALKDGICWEIRHAAVLALRRAGWDPKTGADPRVTKALLEVLTMDRVERVRLEAIISLGAMGRPADPKTLADVIQALQQQGRARDKPIKLWSHVSLVLVDEKGAEKSLVEIRGLMKSPEREIRVQCLMALGALGTKARPCVPDIIEMLEDKEKEVIAAAIAALTSMDDHGPRVLNPLIKITKGSEQPLILVACMALGQIGVSTADVLDALTAVTQRKELDSHLRQAVEKILEKLKNPGSKK